jgi:lipopolysaccharide assembly outer membrane protein LptD (OstA)
MRKLTPAVLVTLSMAAAVAYAQSETKPQGSYKIQSGGNARTQEGKVYMTRVTIAVQGGVVTADEAVLDRATNQVELTGNVRLQLPDSPKPQQ